MSLSDEDLISSARAGDRDAIEELLDRYGPRVRGELFINPKWRAVVDLDDIMQVTYFDAFFQMHLFRANGQSFLSWLRKIAKNNVRDAVRHLSRHKRPHPDDRLAPPEGEDSLVWFYEIVSGGGTSPSGRASRNEMGKILEAELDQLPRDYGTVIRSIYLEGHAVGEVAVRLGRSPGAVQLLRIRALNRLREQLGGAITS